MPIAPVLPGPRNLITDVAGLAVGNAEDARVRTGVTVLLADRPAVAAVDVRGGAPGTSETDALDLTCIAGGRVEALVLAGGSAFGLDAASGVRGWMAAAGRGLAFAGVVVPVVPTAILFDLTNGGDKRWGDDPPYRRLAIAACAAAGPQFRLGNAGAGMGARAGQLKGGLGSASWRLAEGPTVGALVAANPWGSVVHPGTATFHAWALEQADEMGGQTPPPVRLDPAADMDGKRALPGANTTIGVVATDAELTQPEVRRLALMAHDGFARAIRPVHTPFDGDTIFAVATGRTPLPEPRPLWLARLGTLAADAMARAVARGVYEAATVGPIEGYRDFRSRLEAVAAAP
ncbi:P1 family peptidase [Stella sp.]|uniref:P1 family peptidase n=1 Tax=Stella sp. TaxID=2912054 RepID=UPI0035B0002A